MTSAIEAYQAFDRRQPGWVKVKLEAGGTGGKGARPGNGRGRRPEQPSAPHH
jgi:hypothetical protein